MASVAYLGNSVTAQRASYVDPLHRRLAASWGVAGEPRRAALGGVGSLALAGLLDWLVIRHSPDVCFIECSVADSGGATPPSLIDLGVSSIIEDLLDARILPILLHLPRWDVDRSLQGHLASLYTAVAERYHVMEIDLRHLGGPDDLRDGVHTLPGFSEEIADEIANQLGHSVLPECHSAPLTRHARVRRMPAAEGACTSGASRPSSFRLAMPTVSIETGSTFSFSKPGANFIGLYVVAKSTSGVIRLRSGAFREDIQVWDEWCSRPRIQFIPISAEVAAVNSLSIEATGLGKADRDCQGYPNPVTHCGDAVEILGAAIIAQPGMAQEVLTLERK